MKAITETIKKLHIYTAIKENMTGSESKFKIEAECILKKMLENLSFDSISEIKILENCNLISTVIKAIETETERETNVNLIKKVILNKMLENLDLTSTIMKFTETDSKAEKVSKAVLTQMLVNLKSISTITYKVKLGELKAKYHADLTQDFFYLSFV